MIKINLCPVDELESQYWYVPDVAVFVAVAVAAWMGANWWLGETQRQIDEVTARSASKKEAIAKLQPDLDRFKDLDKDIAALNTKLSALKNITVSKISRYEPLIVLEHLQNLKPEGVWYTQIEIGGNNSRDGFTISAKAFDNLLVAELLSNFRATELQEKDEGDIRTQVFFKELELESSMYSSTPTTDFPDIKSSSTFTIRGRFAESSGGADFFGGGGGGGGTGAGPRPPGAAPSPAAPAPKKSDDSVPGVSRNDQPAKRSATKKF